MSDLLDVGEEHRRAETLADKGDRDLRGQVERGQAPWTNFADRVRKAALVANV